MITPKVTICLTALALTLGCTGAEPSADESVRGWLSWRGPQQDGTSPELDLPEDVTPDQADGSWSYDLCGRGTPVIAGARLYAMGYRGERADLEELLVCLDAQTGERLWEHSFKDFVTDVIYNRFAIGSPTIDPDSGLVYCLTTAGVFSCFSAEGELRWQHSMMSEYGRLTFPNGRTGAPLIDGDLAIIHVANSGWGAQAPARDRFFAFDKLTGESIWSCTPGGPPKDGSFSFPVLAWEDGQRVMYAGLAGGHLVCVNVLTGDPIWKFQMATGGVSTSPLLYKDTVIAIHGKENLDTSTIGRMVAVARGAQRTEAGPAVLDRSSERWRNDLVAFTSSPVLVGDRVYQTVHTGELCCVDAATGEVLWHHKLAPDQIHASPAYGDGKLYVPMNNGTLHVVRPSDDGPEIVQSVQLAGNCLGAPAIAGGRVYVHTTEKLYCFAGGSGRHEESAPVAAATPALGPVTRLQVVPGDVATRTGVELGYRVRGLDAAGQVVEERVTGVAWSGLPGGGTSMGEGGVLSIPPDASPAATTIVATAGDLSASARLRIVREPAYVHDFEDVPLKPDPRNEGVSHAPPPPYWAGATRKWEVRERDGEKVLTKLLASPLFQRAMTMIGHPEMSNYTMQVDILTDGNRRTRSSAGLVNQRYLIALKGNHQELEISSTAWLLKESVKFRWKAKTWYRLKTRVDVNPDGSGVVRAKAWPREEQEPEAWTIEVEHGQAHTHGSPGIWGFTPQSRFHVYLDNLSVTPNV